MRREPISTTRPLPSLLAILIASVLLPLLAVPALPAAATEGGSTTVSVRVLSRGAKLIGDVVGGARIEIRDAESGALLASGVTKGSTGDTDRIMRPCQEPGGPLYATPEAAELRAELDLDRPTLVDVTAEGPLGYEQATARASKRLLLTPGADLTGHGIVLELHGLIVEILQPEAPTPAPAAAGGALPVRARVRMLCSCPTQPDGLWSVERIEARLLRDGKTVAEIPLAFTGETSEYGGTFEPPPPGDYVLEVIASDPATQNFGTARQPVTIGGE